MIDEKARVFSDRDWWQSAGDAFDLDLRGWTDRNEASFADKASGRRFEMPGWLAERILAYESAKPKEWRDIASAPKDGTPVLVHLSAKDIAKRDGWHGPAQVAANRGRGWISIPGMWSCTPVAWRPIPSAMLSAAGDEK